MHSEKKVGRRHNIRSAFAATAAVVAGLTAAPNAWAVIGQVSTPTTVVTPTVSPTTEPPTTETPTTPPDTGTPTTPPDTGTPTTPIDPPTTGTPPTDPPVVPPTVPPTVPTTQETPEPCTLLMGLTAAGLFGLRRLRK